MEKSENYYKRQEYMKQLKIPTFSQIKDELGEDLGNAVIADCPEVLRTELGTEPKLHGAGDTLWTSPSDLLEGLVVLKPPFTNRYIKALMHEGILWIGMEIENRFIKEMEAKCKNSLKEQEDMLVFIAEQERIKAVRDALADRVKYYEEKFENFENDFEERLQEELELLTVRLMDDNLRVLQTQKEQLDEEWQDKLCCEIEETTKTLTLKFLEDLEAQEIDLNRKFSIDLKKLEAKHDAIIELEQSICKETLKQLKHNLECKNISNLVYVLCMERRKCEQNRVETQKLYDEAVAKLSTELKVCDTTIENLKKSVKREQAKIVLKEQCLKEILKQFQKFVYFALKAAPKQGEFLLNIEKLLLYELAETVSNLAKKTEGTPIVLHTRSPPEKEQLIPQSLTLPEDHNCLDELDPPEELSEELFSVIFNDKLYVREDFRNMVSQGIEIRRSNELWNKDVEVLLARLRTSVEETPSGSKKSSRRNSPLQLSIVTTTGTANGSAIPGTQTGSIMVKADQKLPFVNAENVEFFIPETSSRPDHESRRSSVYFVESKAAEAQRKSDASDKIEIQAIVSNQQQMLTEMLLQSELAVANNITQEAVMQRRTSLLLCAKDSLEHHRMSLRTGSIRDDVDIQEVARFRQNVLKIQDDNPILCLKSSVEKIQDSPVLEKIKKMNGDGVELRKDIVGVKPSTEDVLSNRFIDNGIFTESQVAMKKDLTQVNEIIQQASITPRERRFSGLTMAQDSLEIIKSKTSKTHIATKELQQNFIEALEETPSTALPVPRKVISPSISIISKKEKVSIIEKPVEINVIEVVPEQTSSQSTRSASKESTVVFSKLPKVYHTDSIVVNPDRTWRVYEQHYQGVDKSGEQPKRTKADVQGDNFLLKENVGKIEGSDQCINTGTAAFTVDRAHSLLAMFKEDPSLMRMFTACSR